MSSDSDEGADIQHIVDGFGDLSKAMQEVNEVDFNKANRFLLEITKTSNRDFKLLMRFLSYFLPSLDWASHLILALLS